MKDEIVDFFAGSERAERGLERWTSEPCNIVEPEYQQHRNMHNRLGSSQAGQVCTSERTADYVA